MTQRPRGSATRFYAKRLHPWMAVIALTLGAATVAGAQDQIVLPGLTEAQEPIQEPVQPGQPPEFAPPPPVAESPSGFPLRAAMGGGCPGGHCGIDTHGHCIPGRVCPCSHCEGNTYLGRVMCHVYHELCCPDPCYEPQWIPAANAAMFVEGTRPVTTTIIRYDGANNFRLPDRGEWFWARSGGGGRGPAFIENALDYYQLSLYQEVAAKGFSFFTQIPYLTVDPDVNFEQSGFGDIILGTKSLLFDRDLFQIGFMFKTYLPVGKPGDGLGTGHVSLEPSLLFTCKITPDTYWQNQVLEWIPIGGDPVYEGAVFSYRTSLNHVLWRPLPDVCLIGTAEFIGNWFQDGAYSDPVLGQFQRASGESYLAFGGGLRLVICQWLDIGGGANFDVDDPGAEQGYRFELRIRY